MTLRHHAVLRRASSSATARLRLRRGTQHAVGRPVRPAASPSSGMWTRHERDRQRDRAASSSPRSASSSRAWSAATRRRARRSRSRPRTALEVLALISLSLGVINLFPFLPLDGGHIFWALAEKVRGRRDPVQRHGAGRVIGFALVICAVPRRPVERHRPARTARAQGAVAFRSRSSRTRTAWRAARRRRAVGAADDRRGVPPSRSRTTRTSVAVRTQDDERLADLGRAARARRRARRRPAPASASGAATRVALMLANRPEFHIADLAAMTLGATPFSIYLTSAPEQIALRDQRRRRAGARSSSDAFRGARGARALRSST